MFCFTQIPEKIENLKQLEVLNLYATKTIALPKGLKKLKKLRRVELTDLHRFEIEDNSGDVLENLRKNNVFITWE